MCLLKVLFLWFSSAVAPSMCPAALQEVCTLIGQVGLDRSGSQIGHRPISLLAGTRSLVQLLILLVFFLPHQMEVHVNSWPQKANKSDLGCILKNTTITVLALPIWILKTQNLLNQNHKTHTEQSFKCVFIYCYLLEIALQVIYCSISILCYFSFTIIYRKILYFLLHYLLFIYLTFVVILLHFPVAISISAIQHYI